MQHPFWDPDLIELLVRVRPHTLNRGGRSKGLVRSALAHRFPGLGFEDQRKGFGANILTPRVSAQAGAVWQKMGELSALGDLGVLDSEQATGLLEDVLAGKRQDWGLLFDLLNLELWARAHR